MLDDIFEEEISGDACLLQPKIMSLGLPGHGICILTAL